MSILLQFKDKKEEFEGSKIKKMFIIFNFKKGYFYL
jgi:hypothetical protein